MVVYYSEVYMVELKSESEFWGNIGNTILFMMLGEGNKEWLEGHFPYTSESKLTRKSKTVVLEKTDDPNRFLDGCLVFIPEIFSESKHYSELKKIVDSTDFIDLDLNKPENWDIIRNDCIQYMGRLNIETCSFGSED